MLIFYFLHYQFYKNVIPPITQIYCRIYSEIALPRLIIQLRSLVNCGPKLPVANKMPIKEAHRATTIKGQRGLLHQTSCRMSHNSDITSDIIVTWCGVPQ